jgi:hypothetical protein
MSGYEIVAFVLVISGIAWATLMFCLDRVVDACARDGPRMTSGWMPPKRPPQFPDGITLRGKQNVSNTPDPYQTMREKILAAMNEYEVATGRSIDEIALRKIRAHTVGDSPRLLRELLIDVAPKAGDAIG